MSNYLQNITLYDIIILIGGVIMKICVYGDSITAMGGWTKVVKLICKVDTIYNRGVGGSCFHKNNQVFFCTNSGEYFNRPCPDIVVKREDIIVPENTELIDAWLSSTTRIKTIPLDSDIIFIMGGTNDMWQSTPIGTLKDIGTMNDDTFIGSVAKTINTIKTRYPDVKLIIGSPISDNGEVKRKIMFKPMVNKIGLTMKDYSEALKDVCNEMNIDFIDVFRKSGINNINRVICIKDTVHPNKIGKFLIGICIGVKLKKIIRKAQ